MRILIAYLRKYWLLLIGQLSFATLWAASQLAIPQLMVNVIDAGVAQGNMELIVQNGLYMIGATLINIAALLINVYFLTQLNGRVSRDLRGDLFARIIAWSKETRLNFTNATLITRTVNDVKQVSNFIDLSLRKTYTTAITVIGASWLAFSLDARLASITLIIIPVVLTVSLALIWRAVPE